MEKQEKRNYLSPVCQIVTVSETTYLMETSFPSQPKKAPHASGPSAPAKSFGLWSDEHFDEGSSDEANDDSSSSWDD